MDKETFDKIFNCKEIQDNIDIINDCFDREQLRRALKEVFYYMIDTVAQIKQGNLSLANITGGIYILKYLIDAQHIFDTFIKGNFDFEKETNKLIADARKSYNNHHNIKE